MGYRTVSTLARAMYWLHLIYESPVWGRLRKERRCAVTQWSLAAHRCLFIMGPRYGRRARSVNRLRWLRIVDIRALWRPGFLQQFLWMVSADPITVWGEYANPLTTWFLEVARYCGWFQVVPISCRRCLNHRILLCVAHWNVWRHLPSSRWFAYSLSFLCRRWLSHSKLFLIVMKCFCNVQLTRDYSSVKAT